jgi:hypothetical protein
LAHAFCVLVNHIKTTTHTEGKPQIDAIDVSEMGLWFAKTLFKQKAIAPLLFVRLVKPQGFSATSIQARQARIRISVLILDRSQQ